MSAASGVHDARKRVKKLRAALRLVRAGFDGAAAEGAALRDAAQGLSGARDAEVMLAVFDRIALPGEAADVRARLAARVTARQDSDAAFADFLAAIAPVRDRARSWTVKGKTARVLTTGLARARARGQQAMTQALHAGPESEAMHDWRKRVKDLWYQARLFHPVWPAAMDPLVMSAGDLGEMLGDHHDLVVFRALMSALEPALLGQAEPLRGRALEQMTAIGTAARPLSARLLAGRPDAIAAQWVDWWRLWRRQG